MTGPVTYRSDESIAVIAMDDGKVNVLGMDMQQALNDALDTAENDPAGAVVIAGNQKVFSGGFDLKVFQSGDLAASVAMLRGGFELSYRLLSFPKPVVMACTGHAIAMGSFLLCSGDHRVAAPGYNIQANEVAIGMVPPYAALEVLKLRLTRSAYQQATGLAKVFFGEAAQAAGWIDEIAMPDKVLARAEESAREFTNLHRGAHLATKLRARAEALEGIRAGIDNIEAEFGASG
ncbi:crotonase/enoyl-CoA hydratase family protein [Mycolicibacterium palauense]|uniref:crotonase/enoyl-CoA hydratase family protein n=1 Tax=Mycolicibacterium palauense TaxID=2034511 RepID=UPI000BFEB631|nr:crotonase/enoyl-CoA hydratase family protein [Mycolicibacterium palauense]